MSTYDGDPAVYPETVTVPDDGDNEDAGSVDVPLEALLDRTAWLKLHADQDARSRVMNWPYGSGTFLDSSTKVCFGTAYSAVFKRWISIVKTTTSTVSFYSSPDGHEWTIRNAAITGTSTAKGPGALACSPTIASAPGLAVSVAGPYASGGVSTIYKCTIGVSSSFDLLTSQGSIGCTAAVFFAGLFIFAGPGLLTEAIADPDDGIVLASATALNAASFTTTRIATAVSTGDAVGIPWLLAAGPAICLAVAQKPGVSFPTSTTTDGITWTPHTDTSLAALEVVFSIAWDEVRSLFVRTTGNPAAFTSKVWTSPDGVAWSLVSTLAGDQLRAIGCLGGEWVATGKSGAIDVAYREAYRSSDAGAHWYSAGARQSVDGGAWLGATAERQRVITSDRQFLLTSDIEEIRGSVVKGVDYGVLT